MEMMIFTQGMRTESGYFYIRIFRLVIIEQFHRVTVLLVLISAVARTEYGNGFISFENQMEWSVIGSVQLWQGENVHLPE